MARASRLGRQPGTALQRKECQTEVWALPENDPGRLRAFQRKTNGYSWRRFTARSYRELDFKMVGREGHIFKFSSSRLGRDKGASKPLFWWRLQSQIKGFKTGFSKCGVGYSYCLYSPLLLGSNTCRSFALHSVTLGLHLPLLEAGTALPLPPCPSFAAPFTCPPHPPLKWQRSPSLSLVL